MTKTQIESALQEARNRTMEEKNMTTQVLDLVAKEEGDSKIMGKENKKIEVNTAPVQKTDKELAAQDNVTASIDKEATKESEVVGSVGATLDDKKDPKIVGMFCPVSVSIPGVKIIGKCTAEVATDSLRGNRLHIRALLSKETNKRKYQVFEVDQAGKELGTISCESLFRASEVLSGTSSKIKHFIQDLDGNYSGQMADILSRIAMIEKERVLSPEEVLDIDSCKTVEEFWKKLEDWFESHLDDVRVGVVDIKGRTHVALVKRGKTGLNEIFKAVCGEIAPKMKSSLIKGELYRRDLLIHDCNPDCKDTQLTVGAMVQYELGIVNDKIISFAFDDAVIRSIKEGYEIYRITEED